MLTAGHGRQLSQKILAGCDPVEESDASLRAADPLVELDELDVSSGRWASTRSK